MKKMILVLFVSFFVFGCAGLQAQKIESQNQVNDYWKNPENKVLLTVAKVNDFYGYATINCDFSVNSFSENGSSNNSFEAGTPLVKVFDFSENIKESKKQYAALNNNEKDLMLASFATAGPGMSVVCQSESSGIEATAYFDGKKIAHSITTQYQGLVSLSFSPPFADKIKEASVG